MHYHGVPYTDYHGLALVLCGLPLALCITMEYPTYCGLPLRTVDSHGLPYVVWNTTLCTVHYDGLPYALCITMDYCKYCGLPYVLCITMNYLTYCGIPWITLHYHGLAHVLWYVL